ncbi:MAG: hypothetical protein KGJ41_11610 [Rhodospirillales bacterium]|nr:hypothetical protein [Rhodospirillales bacterium]MDE2574079.1 hypothetical protein [Rhodospirillales bacterium]
MIDQQTFEGRPQAPTKVTAPLPASPLVTLRMDGQDFRPALAEALGPVLARSPAAAFEVLTPVPTAAAADVQQRAIRQGGIDAQSVATALAYDGVDPARVHLGLVADPGSPAREVRVFVR